VRGWFTELWVTRIRKIGRNPALTGGASLVGQLVALAARRGVEIWLKSAVTELITGERSPRSSPGDLGTKGGLVTDEHARVLREDGSVIEGLYAAGNTTATVMGRSYPGPGCTIGAAMVFAYLGARHL
jgi:hypothetical protein